MVKFAMRIQNYNHTSETKQFEASPHKIAQRLIAVMGNARDSEEQLYQSPRPEVNAVSSLRVISVVAIQESALAVEQLVRLLSGFAQVKIIGTATEGVAGLELCTGLCPDAVFLDVNLSNQAGMSLPTRLAALQDPPWLVFTANSSDQAAYAFRLEAVDYLMKPLDRPRVSEAINRLLVQLQPVEFGALAGSPSRALPLNPLVFNDASRGLLPVKIDHDEIRLLARHEIVAALSRRRRTWIHTVLAELPTYYSLTQLMHWLNGEPFIQVARHAIVNLRGIQEVWQPGHRFCRLRLHDRAATVINASRSGSMRLQQHAMLGG